jgi:nitroimidazol reductase NimA-like FMN-containing flavoprotein (pyridoxamine 5'-phosphate oxidase superfamily)
MIIREMSHADCVALLAKSWVGRLACCKENVPYVVPIQFAYVDNRIVSFSLPGQKIDWMRANPRVCIQIDDIADKHRWKCLLVNGVFKEQVRDEQRDRAWAALKTDNDWWEPGSFKPGPQAIASERNHVFYAVDIDTMTGREAFDG